MRKRFTDKSKTGEGSLGSYIELPNNREGRSCGKYHERISRAEWK